MGDNGVPEWTVADRLRKAREMTGLDQGDFAHELGVSRGTISNYEHGHVRPREVVIRAWALRTGVSIQWIKDGDPPADARRAS